MRKKACREPVQTRRGDRCKVARQGKKPHRNDRVTGSSTDLSKAGCGLWALRGPGTGEKPVRTKLLKRRKKCGTRERQQGWQEAFLLRIMTRGNELCCYDQRAFGGGGGNGKETWPTRGLWRTKIGTCRRMKLCGPKGASPLPRRPRATGATTWGGRCA